ncbi:MAG: hypothetical protein ACRCV9_01485 [Burkholderiaceae bacterium]
MTPYFVAFLVCAAMIVLPTALAAGSWCSLKAALKFWAWFGLGCFAIGLIGIAAALIEHS